MKTPLHSPSSARLLAAITTLGLGASLGLPTSASAQATTGFNQTGAGPFDYNTSTNWVDGNINGTWDVSLIRTATQTVTFGTNTTLSGPLVFGYTGDYSTTLRADGTGPYTLTLGGDITVALTGASGKTIAIGSNTAANQNLNVNLDGVRTINVTNNTLTFANNVSNGGIIKTGAGSLFFQRAADYSGATIVNAGTLRFDTSSASVANSDITANLGTTVQFASSGTTLTRAKSVTLNGATLTGAGTSGGHSVDAITNALTIGYGASTVTLTSHASFNERLSAASFVRESGGGVLFRGTSLGVNDIGSTVANSTNISFGSTTGLLNQVGSGTTIGIIAGAYGDTVSGGNGFGATGGLVTYDAAKGVRLLDTSTEYTSAIVSGQTTSDNVRHTTPGTTTLTHATTTINSLSFDASGAAGTQGITIAGDAATKLVINSGMIYTDFNSISGTPVAADSVTISVPVLDFNAKEGVVLVSTGGTANQQNYPARLYINSEITNGSLTKSGAGQLQLAGAVSNTYTGTTTVNQGTLSLMKTGGAQAIVGDVVVNGGFLFQNDNQIADTSNVTVNGGQWRLANSTSGASPKSETVATLTVNGGSAYGGNGSAATATLNVTGAVAVTNTGQIQSATGYIFNFGSLSVGNGGTVTMAAANNLTGGNLTVGALTITNTTGGAYTPISLVAGSSKGATLILNGDVTFNGNSTNTNTTTINAAAGTTLGRINLNGGTRIFTVNNGAAEIDLSIIPAIDNGGLVKSGLGTLELAGVNTYTGATVVNAGTLALSASGSLDAASALTVAAGATFDASEQAAYAFNTGVATTIGVNASAAGLIKAAEATFTGASLVFDFGSLSSLAESYTVFEIFGSAETGNFTSVSATGDSISGLFLDAGDGLWTLTSGAMNLTFNINDGTLMAAVPEPSAFAALAGLATPGRGPARPPPPAPPAPPPRAPPPPPGAGGAPPPPAASVSPPPFSHMTKHPLPALLRRALLAAGVLAVSILPLQAQDAATAKSLIGNSSMEAGSDWPSGWPRHNNASWQTEEGNRFIRLSATEPGKMIMLYSEIGVPKGVEALELSWRQRVTGLKRGKQAWFDARVMLGFMDSTREKITPDPKPVATGRDTDGWVSRSTSFLVPEGASILKFMPSLFNVEAGTFDIDDVVLVPVDPAPLREAAAAAAVARAEKLARDTAAAQQRAAATLATGGSLVTNGNFETPNKAGDAPADWGRAGWGTDPDGNRFLRLVSTVPGKTVMTFRSVSIPADAKALELSLRWRITDLKPGAMPWHDARIMMDVKDASGNKLKPGPGPLYSRSNTKDGAWVSRTTSFLVPEGGVTLDLMPSLFEVKAGTFDIDDIVLKPTDPTAIIAAQKEREARAAKARVPHEEPVPANFPPAIRAQGNRLVTVDAGKEVWLQGMNVASLEWSVTGEQIHKSIVVGIDEWKGNVIRLPVKHDYWFGRKGQTDGGKSYRAIVDQAITLAANRGAYLVLDLHTYRAPKDEYLEFWTDAATRYKNHPAVIFDLMNEPHGISWAVWRDGGFVGEKTDRDEATFLTPEERAKAQGFQSPGMQKMLDTVRATGAKNMVLVGGLDYAYRLDGIVEGFGLKDHSGGQGIIYACHIYPWKSQWQKMLLDAAALHPILLGEVGADANKMNFMPHEQQEDWQTWTPAILGLIQQHRLNYTAWCFHPKASPRMLLDWDYTPTPFWGQQVKDALSGKQFPPPDRLR